MYDRNVQGDVLTFDTSGALYHSALVMQDDQSDSFWAMISSSAIGGKHQGNTLTELPISEKTTWADWKARYPHTKVLIHNGQVHIDTDPYVNYFGSDKTFGELSHRDRRLPLKESIFTFTHKDKPYALSHQSLVGGWKGKAGGTPLFLYRPKGASIYLSTKAWLLNHEGKRIKLRRTGGVWSAKGLGILDPKSGRFDSGLQLEPFMGLDSFWYIWSQYHPKTILLGQAKKQR